MLANKEITVRTIHNLFLIFCIPGLIYSNFRIYPNYLSYFNFLAGGPEKGHRILVDSNIDWGQDLKLLKQYMMDNRIDQIYFAYFGSLDPAYYNIKYRYLPSSFYRYTESGDKLLIPTDPPPKRKILAISVTYLYEIPVYRWLAEIPPAGMLGYSIYIYDLTNNPDAWLNIIRAYILTGAYEYARTELKDLWEIDPDNTEVKRLLKLIGE
jgi:hypothetical protein